METLKLIAIAGILALSTLCPVLAQDSPVRKVGETFVDGEFSISVTKAFYCSSMTDSLGQKTVPAPGATFLVVFYSVTNNGAETRSISAQEFKLKIASGDEYSSDQGDILDALVMMMKEPVDNFFTLILQPKVAKRSASIFEVPTSAIKGEVRFLIPAHVLLVSLNIPTSEVVAFTPQPSINTAKHLAVKE